MDDLRVRAVAKSPGLQKFPLAKKSDRLRKLKVRPVVISRPEVRVLAEAGMKLRFTGWKNWVPDSVYKVPVIVMQDTSTILVEPGCYAEITEYGDVILNVETKTYQ